MSPLKAYRRSARKMQILMTLRIRAEKGQPPEITMYKLARALDMTPSSHLVSILDEMVAEGILVTRKEFHRKNVEKTIYALPEGTYSMPAPGHNIRLNIQGQVYQERLL